MAEPRAKLAIVLAGLVLAGCETVEGSIDAAGAALGGGTDETARAAPAPDLPAPQPGGPAVGRAPLAAPPSEAPEIYMALQPDSAGIVSVVFAIDRARDNTPSDDPAIRLTPEAGQCNPQELRRFAFPPVYAARPVFSRIEADQEVTADQLPAFMAIAVSTEMIRLGLVERPEDTHPQNVCTRKLWERLVFADAAAG